MVTRAFRAVARNPRKRDVGGTMKGLRTGGRGRSSKGRSIDPNSEEGQRIIRDLARRDPSIKP